MKKINQGNAQLLSLVLVLTIAMMAAPRGIEMIARQQSERVWDVTASSIPCRWPPGSISVTTSTHWPRR
ncbi:hypothetical protein CID34_19310 [Salmonella enterica]|nr:hypothetical protein [Salmonella enterica]